MITEGCIVKSEEIRGTIGAVVNYDGKICAITAGHVIRYGNGKIGTKVKVDGHESRVIKLINDYDLAIIEVPRNFAKISEIGYAYFGPARLMTNEREIDCRVIDTGRNLNRFAFPCGNMPYPGDSGAPVLQDEKVVAILSSILYNNCTGLGISSQVFGTPSRLR